MPQGCSTLGDVTTYREERRFFMSAHELQSTTSNQWSLATNWTPHVDQRSPGSVLYRRDRLPPGKVGDLRSHRCPRLSRKPGRDRVVGGLTYDDANHWRFENIVPLLPPDFLAGEPKLTNPRVVPLTTGTDISFRITEQSTWRPVSRYLGERRSFTPRRGGRLRGSRAAVIRGARERGQSPRESAVLMAGRHGPRRSRTRRPHRPNRR